MSKPTAELDLAGPSDWKEWPRTLLNPKPTATMPRGDKSKYTSKQKRQAEHIEEGYEKKGVSKKTAEARAWATVNKSTKGGKKSGSGRGKKVDKSPAKKGGRKGGAASKKKTSKKKATKKKAPSKKRASRK
jgi:plasmid stabilization system protein ParE